jgi:hypothetical protein
MLYHSGGARMEPTMRCIALMIALAAIGIVGSVDRANAADARRVPEAENRPQPPAVPLCCGWAWFCSRNDCSELYPWRAEAIARYDDAWCLQYGPRGSHVYAQCRENLYYERASLPLRAIK